MVGSIIIQGKMKISIALAQIHIRLGETSANLSLAKSMLQSAAGVQLFLLPELWSSGYLLDQAQQLSEESVQLLAELSQVAVQSNTHIGGSLLTRRENQVYNTFHLLSPTQPPVQYEKLHLFRLMQEEQYLAPGSQSVWTDLPWGRNGMAICYDLRFPELFRQYALAGARCILLVSEWPLRRIEHWKTLLQARAIENQLFMIAVNSVGETGAETFGGHSAVISPWGTVIAEAGSTEECLLRAEIDLDEVDEFRRRIPVFTDRRPDIYGDCNR
jgi:omega-amidase